LHANCLIEDLFGTAYGWKEKGDEHRADQEALDKAAAPAET
jgi:hypothetical protein